MYTRIKDLREDADLLQADVADYLNCSQACYSNYERGTRAVPCEVLAKLALFYHTSADYILGMTNERTPYPRVKGLGQKKNRAKPPD